MKTIITILVATILTGCASTDYNKYTDMQISIQTARSNAEAEKYKAIAAIAQSGDTTAKVAAMFSLQSNGQNQQAVQLAAPKSTSDNIRDWVGILVPSLIQGYGIHANTQMGMRQSDNATALGMSTNTAFVGMAGHIQAPAANITTTLSGTGTLGSGSYSTDTHAITGSYNPAPVTTDNSNQGNPVDNSNQNNPVTNPSNSAAP